MPTPVSPPSAPPFAIAHLTRLDEFERCVDLQGAVWGYDETDIVPRRIFLLARKIGGQVVGAFAGGSNSPRDMVGFAMALPGYRDGMAYLHSHMLAVLPEHRNAGLGVRLKLAQRDDAIARGFDLMEWTFDPLEIKNAYLNIHKLGAIARRYQPDFYGPSSSVLQAGLPTDRLYAEWWLRAPRVAAAVERLHSVRQPEAAIEFQPVQRIEVPHAISDWKRDPECQSLAASLQRTNREAFQAAFADGLGVLGFERDAHGSAAYLLADAAQVTAQLSSHRDGPALPQPVYLHAR
jgi:predicted GNAT superfamily acetyltransferase